MYDGLEKGPIVVKTEEEEEMDLSSLEKGPIVVKTAVSQRIVGHAYIA